MTPLQQPTVPQVVSSYLPNYQKKTRILLKRERQLRHALRNGFAEAKIRRAAEEVRAARVRRVEATLAQLPPCHAQGRDEKRAELEAAVASAKRVSLDALIHEFRRGE